MARLTKKDDLPVALKGFLGSRNVDHRLALDETSEEALTNFDHNLHSRGTAESTSACLASRSIK